MLLQILSRTLLENTWKNVSSGNHRTMTIQSSILTDLLLITKVLLLTLPSETKKGCHVLAGAKKISSYHVPIYEALALQYNFMKIQVECESKLIMNCVPNKCWIS